MSIERTRWGFTRQTGDVGRFQIVFSKPGGRPVDVTFFRGAPTNLVSFSSGDPFGDSTAVIAFPQIGGFDDLDGTDVGAWLGDFANVDIYWVSYAPGTDEVDPRTNAQTLQVASAQKVWEGYVASMEFTQDESKSSLSVQCQGALFQLDRYMEKPAYPPRPIPHETLIQAVFDPTTRPHLRTQPLTIEWPIAWALKIPWPEGGKKTIWTIDGMIGAKYTGFSTRDTGSWSPSLTGFVQDLLSVMYTDFDSGTVPGNQWTIRKDIGRKPVLYVRDRFRPADFSLWFGQVGLTCSFTRDTTSMANVIYGDGTDTAGVGWRNAVISDDGSRTSYQPLAASGDVYPIADNPGFSRTAFTVEKRYSYGPGFGLVQARDSAQKSLARDMEPGWSGTITLKVDPSPTFSRWMIRAGMTMKLQGFAGSGVAGISLHIAEVQASVEAGTVTMTVDTRYRDLLNLEESRVRARDPMTPSRMLKVGQRSQIIEDMLAPWDYTAGSGFVKRASLGFFNSKPEDMRFPWVDWLKAFPPQTNGQYYVPVRADHDDKNRRWTLGTSVPILLSEKGTIIRTEIVCCNDQGEIVPAKFHFSIYKTAVTLSAMPMKDGIHDPFEQDAFESVPLTGGQFPSGSWNPADVQLLVGWGNAAQPAGYSPGRFSDGDDPTGLLVDEAPWTFDLSSNPNFPLSNQPGKVPPSVVTAYGAFYAEWTEPVYFIGRLWRQEQTA